MRAEAGTCTVRTFECWPHLSMDRAGDDVTPLACAKIVQAREADVDSDDDGDSVRPESTTPIAVSDGEADGESDRDEDEDGWVFE